MVGYSGSYGSLYGGGYSTGYNLNSFIAQDWRGWDRYENRLQRYDVFDGYYHNIAYHSIVTYSQSLKTTERLYKHVRGVYNPVNRLVESYVNKVVSGKLDMQDAETGAIPIVTNNEALRPAIVNLWRDSAWQQKKSLFVRNGAKNGDSFIKVVDDIQRQHVRMEVLDPAKVKEVKHDPTGKIEYICIEYYIEDGKTWSTYTETITPDSFTIQVNNKPANLYQNARGQMVDGWDNEYGFVPVIHTLHTDVGLRFGAPAFHGALHKVNELNDLASILNDGMRKQVQMPLVFKNVTPSGNLDLGSDGSGSSTNPHDNPKKDSVPGISITGENADVITLSPSINIADGLLNINAVLDELERDFPELALHRLRDSGNLTAPGVTSAYDDAISSYKEARGAYDSGQVEAHKMAIGIGGMRGYDGYQGFNLMSLENDQLDHSIAERPVINDVLGKSEKINLTMQAIGTNAPEDLYREMGWSEQQAKAFVGASETVQTNTLVQTRSSNVDQLVSLGRQVRKIGQSAATRQQQRPATDNAGNAA